MEPLIEIHDSKIDECKQKIKYLQHKITNLNSNEASKHLGIQYCKSQIEINCTTIRTLEQELEILISQREDLKNTTSSYYLEQLEQLKFKSLEYRRLEEKTNKKMKRKLINKEEVDEQKEEKQYELNYKERKKIKKQEENKSKQKQQYFKRLKEENFVRDFQLESYWNVTDSLPNYMLNNLQKLPNNYGYIWKKTWFLGHLKPESSTQIMFERLRDGTYNIHEYYRNGHIKIYNKKDPHYMIKKYIYLKQ